MDSVRLLLVLCVAALVVASPTPTGSESAMFSEKEKGSVSLIVLVRTEISPICSSAGTCKLVSTVGCGPEADETSVSFEAPALPWNSISVAGDPSTLEASLRLECDLGKGSPYTCPSTTMSLWSGADCDHADGTSPALASLAASSNSSFSGVRGAIVFSAEEVLRVNHRLEWMPPDSAPQNGPDSDGRRSKHQRTCSAGTKAWRRLALALWTAGCPLAALTLKKRQVK
jgi:hypothetical protein